MQDKDLVLILFKRKNRGGQKIHLKEKVFLLLEIYVEIKIKYHRMYKSFRKGLISLIDIW